MNFTCIDWILILGRVIYFHLQILDVKYDWIFFLTAKSAQIHFDKRA